MSATYDTPAKKLMEFGPDQWARLTHFIPPNAIIEVEDPILPVTSFSVDKLFKIREGDHVWWLVLEFQSQLNRQLLKTANFREVLVRKKFEDDEIEVTTAIIYSHPSALPKDQEDGVVYFPRRNGKKNKFEFDVIKLWEIPYQELLDGGIAIAPLAVLGKIHDTEMPSLMRKLEEKFAGESVERKDELWGSTSLLLGLKYNADLVAVLMAEVQKMENSSVYQRAVKQGLDKGEEIGIEKGIEKGRDQEKIASGQRHLRLILDKLYPNHSASVNSLIEQTTNPDKLEQAITEAISGSGWERVQELLS